LPNWFHIFPVYIAAFILSISQFSLDFVKLYILNPNPQKYFLRVKRSNKQYHTGIRTDDIERFNTFFRGGNDFSYSKSQNNVAVKERKRALEFQIMNIV